MEDSAKEEDEGLNPTERRWLMGLSAAALLSRRVWVLWVHPPELHVFSDMGRDVGLAQDLVEDGFRRDPHRAFWPWGAPALFGDHGLRATTDVYAFLLALSAGAAAKNAWSMSSKR